MKLVKFLALAGTLALLATAAHDDARRRDEAASGGAGSTLWSADDPALIQKLENHLSRATRDGRGWVILARLYFASDRYEDASRAFERGLASSSKVAQDPQVWCELADALGMAQGGSLKGRPREMIEKALGLKGSHPRALEMAGSAAVETRDYDRALLYWAPLLVQLDPQSREYRELQAAVDRLRHAGGTVPRQI